jgi:hypothetical protein
MPGKVRSPSFPFVSLPEAVQRARLLYEAERRNPVLAEVAVAHWGYAPKSSGGRQTIAALKAFGLMEDVGGRLRLTDVGQHLVVRERGSPEHSVLLRQVALSPPLFRKLWDRYGPGLPPVQSLRSYLVLELKLNENAVEDLVRSYRETVAVIGTEAAPAPPAPPDDLTLRFPLGELRAVRRIRSGEEPILRALFEAWLEQIREKPGEGS